jgi:hypothetical protein
LLILTSIGALVEHVVRDSVSVEIQQGETTVARISPVVSGVPLSALNAALASVPPLGDDAESFADDLKRWFFKEQSG